MKRNIAIIIENIIKMIVTANPSYAMDAFMETGVEISNKLKREKYEQSIRNWINCYVNTYTGTVVDKDAFWKYIDNKDVIEQVRRFVFDDINDKSESKLISELASDCYSYCSEINHDIHDSDINIIKGFFVGLIGEYRHILTDNQELCFRALQYNLTNTIHVDFEKMMDQLEVVRNKITVSDTKVDRNVSNVEKFVIDGNGWDNSSGKWRYLKDNSPMTDTWKSANGNWFYLGSDGDMLTDTIIDDNGVLYYVDKYGAMVKNTWKAVEKDAEIEGGHGDYWWMYFGSDGRAYKGVCDGGPSLKLINENTYAFDENGHMMSGWVNMDIDRNIGSDEAWKVARYYFGDWNDGTMAVGWRIIEIKTADGITEKELFYFDPNGRKQCNIKCRKGQHIYKLGNDGRIVDENIVE